MHLALLESPCTCDDGGTGWWWWKGWRLQSGADVDCYLHVACVPSGRGNVFEKNTCNGGYYCIDVQSTLRQYNTVSCDNLGYKICKALTSANKCAAQSYGTYEECEAYSNPARSATSMEEPEADRGHD
jgi:hypothetical protein